MEVNLLSIANQLSINWKCKHTWKRSSYNTSWCLLGCSIGDCGTIAYFQFMGIQWPVLAIMILAIVNGLITSIILETIILSRQMAINLAFKTAIKNIEKHYKHSTIDLLMSKPRISIC